MSTSMPLNFVGLLEAYVKRVLVDVITGAGGSSLEPAAQLMQRLLPVDRSLAIFFEFHIPRTNLYWQNKLVLPKDLPTSSPGI